MDELSTMWNWFIALQDSDKISAVNVFLVALGLVGTTVYFVGSKVYVVAKKWFYLLAKNDKQSTKSVHKKPPMLGRDGFLYVTPVTTTLGINETQAVEEAMARLQRLKDTQHKQIYADLEKGDIDAAIEKFKTLDQVQSQWVEEYLKRIQQTVETKLDLAALLTYRDPIESERLLIKSVELAPDNLKATNSYGELLFHNGHIEKAITAFNLLKIFAETKDDSNWKGIALSNLGISYGRLGQNDKAIKYHKQALEVSREIKEKKDEGNHL